jgi:preprotein translocase subunit SecD
MKKMIVLFILVVIGCAIIPATSQAVTLEFRPGSQSPMEGLTEMTVVGTDQKVYISQDVVVSNNDIVSAEFIEGFGSPQILIVFTRAGVEKFSRATENNIGKPLGIVIDGQLFSAPIVREMISSPRMIISGRFTQEEALRIVNGINKK